MRRAASWQHCVSAGEDSTTTKLERLFTARQCVIRKFWPAAAGATTKVVAGRGLSKPPEALLCHGTKPRPNVSVLRLPCATRARCPHRQPHSSVGMQVPRLNMPSAYCSCARTKSVLGSFQSDFSARTGPGLQIRPDTKPINRTFGY